MESFRLLLAPLFVSLLFGAAAGTPAQAQSWPTRPIVLVYGFGTGSADAIARRFADFASKELGQPVIVENRMGSGGVLAAMAVAKADPDGYTIMLQANGPMILRPILDTSVG